MDVCSELVFLQAPSAAATNAATAEMEIKLCQVPVNKFSLDVLSQDIGCVEFALDFVYFKSALLDSFL